MNDPVEIRRFSELSRQQQEDHRAKIGAKIESILLSFWREENIPDLVRAYELQGWVDVLEVCSHSEIRAAWTDYQKNGPRSANRRLLKPDAGALWQIVLASLPKPKATPIVPQIVESPRLIVTMEQRQSIMRETWGGDFSDQAQASNGHESRALGALAQAVLRGEGQASEAKP
jgi:hypothetical protein